MPVASGGEVAGFLAGFDDRAGYEAALRELTPSWRRRLVVTTLIAWGVAGVSLLAHTGADIAGVAYAEEFMGALAVFSIPAAVVLTQAVVLSGLGGGGWRAAMALERVGVCPSCLYDLRGTPPSGDGDVAVVCPECGAAWRVGGEEGGTDGA